MPFVKSDETILKMLLPPPHDSIAPVPTIIKFYNSKERLGNKQK